jgi:uncharacterized protein (TIGR02453 family)
MEVVLQFLQSCQYPFIIISYKNPDQRKIVANQENLCILRRYFMNSVFTGFNPEALRFLDGLRNNNNKEWFEEHREDYDNFVLTPARNFVVDMGSRLAEIAPGIIADPKVNRSIFRVNRDVRFSKDKRPYKTHLGIWFWEGTESRMDCPGFYFHLEPGNFLLAAGMHCFSKPSVNKFREMAVHPEMGEKLAKTVNVLEKLKDYQIGEKTLKKIPRGFDAKHPNADFLLYTGFVAFQEGVVPEEIFTDRIFDYTMKRFKDMLPIHQWLLEMKKR